MEGAFGVRHIIIHKIHPVILIIRSEEHKSELQSHLNLVCRLLLEKKKKRFHPALLPSSRTARDPAPLCRSGFPHVTPGINIQIHKHTLGIIITATSMSVATTTIPL